MLDSPRYFGFSHSEFPYMYMYIARTRGRDAALCLVMHIVLDILEDLFARGYEPEAAKDIVLKVVEGYEEECGRTGCEGYEEVFTTIRRLLDTLHDSLTTSTSFRGLGSSPLLPLIFRGIVGTSS